MTETEELKQRIAQLETKVKAQSEIISLMKNMNASNELSEYINKKLCVANLAKLVSDVSANKVSTENIKRSIDKAKHEKEYWDDRILTEMASVADTHIPVSINKLVDTALSKFSYGAKNKEVQIHSWLGGKNYYSFNYENDKEDDVIVPSSINGLPVTSIGYEAFSHANVSFIHLPNTIKTFSEGSFWMSSIKTIKIPPQITNIPYKCFAACSSLEYVILNDGLESIGVNAFSGHAIRKLIIPSSVKYIQDEAFVPRVPMQVLFEGSDGNFSEYTFQSRRYGSLVPVTLYYKDKRILPKLRILDSGFGTINHNVDDFYKI